MGYLIYKKLSKIEMGYIVRKIFQKVKWVINF